MAGPRNGGEGAGNVRPRVPYSQVARPPSASHPAQAMPVHSVIRMGHLPPHHGPPSLASPYHMARGLPVYPYPPPPPPPVPQTPPLYGPSMAFRGPQMPFSPLRPPVAPFHVSYAPRIMPPPAAPVLASRPLLPDPAVCPTSPLFSGRQAWDCSLVEALKLENQQNVLTCPKHGVSLKVFRQPRKDVTAGGEEADKTEAKEEEGQWVDDPRVAVDLGVVPLIRPTRQDEEEEERVEESFVPVGYEDAPPVVMITTTTRGDEEEEEEGEGEGENEVEGETVVRHFIKVCNNAQWPVTITEVTILPHDKPESRMWVDVFVGHCRHSSRDRHSDTSPDHEEAHAEAQGEISSQEIAEGQGERGGAGPKLGELLVRPGEERSVQVELHAMYGAEIGCVAKWVLVHLHFPTVGHAWDQVKHSFVVGRRVLACLTDETAQSMLNVEAKPFVPRAYREFFKKPASMVLERKDGSYRSRVVDRALAQLPVGQAGQLAIVTRMSDTYRSRKNPRDEAHKIFCVPQLSEVRSLEGFVGVQHRLLHLEELQAARDIERYDLFNVSLTLTVKDAMRGVLTTRITVPGASENRPYLAYGDPVRIRPSAPVTEGQGPPKHYEFIASVVKSREDVVTLLLPPGTLTEIFPTARFHCRFAYNVTDFRVLHHALDTLPKHAQRLIFPELGPPDDCSPPPAPPLEEPSLSFVHGVINEEQGRAVLDVVQGRQAYAPYIIFGPPGTGKTLTLIEAIVQVCRVVPGARILACAPSDTAADIICDRLSQHIPDKKKLFRLNWWQRKQESLPPHLLAYSLWDSEASVFTLPNHIDAFKKYQVIVSTCASASLLSLLPKASLVTSTRPEDKAKQGAGLSFTHLFIDESSQAQLPEVLVPIALTSPNTQLILSGDPKQLGPTIRSPVAQDLGLGMSLQEFLMRPGGPRMYQASSMFEGDMRCITALRRNYRSHRDIIEVPSRLFYDHQLLECANPSVITSMMDWELLQPPVAPLYRRASAVDKEAKPCPLLFYGILGQDLHESPKSRVVAKYWELLQPPVAPLYRRASAVDKEAKPCPLLFYGILGQDLHELDSPSFFNPVEASKIAELVEALLSSRRVQCKTSDIGIISAFRKQVVKLRAMLRARGLGAINTGQVEDFQGQEQKVTVISTVLSSRHPSEIRQQLGFLGHPKRFNVAVTRAKALTIMVGNPFVLHQDPCWRSLLEFCVQNGAYRGCRCPLLGVQEDDDVDDLLDAVASLSLLGPATRTPHVALPDDLDCFNDSGWRIML